MTKRNLLQTAEYTLDFLERVKPDLQHRGEPLAVRDMLRDAIAEAKASANLSVVSRKNREHEVMAMQLLAEEVITRDEDGALRWSGSGERIIDED